MRRRVPLPWLAAQMKRHRRRYRALLGPRAVLLRRGAQAWRPIG